MSFNEQMKQKAEEVRLQEKAKALGDALGEVLRAAVGAAAGYAAQNRPKVDAMLDRAERSIVEKTGVKHADTVTTVRGQVDKGIDKIVAKHEAPTTTTAPTDSSGVPEDRFTAFPEDEKPNGTPV